MDVLLSSAARTALTRMRSVQCAELARDICVSDLDVPDPVTRQIREVPGVSGRLTDAGDVPLYWRRLIRAGEMDEDIFAPVTPYEDDADSASDWVAIYRQPTPNECINRRTRRADMLVVLHIVENGRLAPYVTARA